MQTRLERKYTQGVSIAGLVPGQGMMALGRSDPKAVDGEGG